MDGTEALNASGGELVEQLEHAAKTPAKQRNVKITGVVDKLCLHAFEFGLSSGPLSTLVDIITLPNEMDQASLGTLIRNLYPAGKVSDSVVVNVVGSLGHGKLKPNLSVQAGLLKWLIMVYDVLQNQKILSQLYAILFNLLGTLALRAPLCHVLSLITRRKHVRAHRIQVLMELTRQAGNEPPLVGLMRVYKDYYPDVIVGDAVSGRASVFTHPNQEWRERLGEIQRLNLAKLPNGRQQRTFSVARKSSTTQRRTRSSMLPEVYTSNALETSVTLEEIQGVNDFVGKLEKIEPPNQLVAVIGDPLLQKFLQLRSSDEYSKRVDMWLMAFFKDQLQTAGQESSAILEMLQAIHSYTRYTKILPDACLTYLNSLLPLWNGMLGREVILDLLTYLPLRSFDETYKATFREMEDAVLDDATIESKLQMLQFYQNLLDRWTTFALAQDSPTKEAATALASLIRHANVLSLTIAQSSQSVTTFSKILSYYESTAVAITYASLKSTVRITTPPAELVYTLTFTSSLGILSRLCAVLALYKRAFELAMAPRQEVDIEAYPKDYVNHFNGFLMDLCNCLWRARALNTTDPNALGCLIDSHVTSTLTTYISGLDTSVLLSSLYSFSTSPALCLLAISYVRDLEDSMEDNIERRHAGPVTQASLKQLELDGGIKLAWQDYKLGVLQYLENNGVAGVGELMYNTMKHLMAARNKKA